MEQENIQTSATAKLPILKQGEYEMWRLRIEQYFYIQDFALWDVIKNGNSFKPVAQTVEGSSTPHIPGHVTADEKIQKKNDVKARSMLLMALLNEHLMTFNQYKDAKILFDAITTRFGRNDATRKTQKTLLKQMYENFNLDKISIDDLYNNFKIVEQEVKRNISPSLSSGSQNMAFVSTPSTSNNDDVNTVFGVSTTSPQAKVECFNCHMMGYFARECRVPMNQENKTRNQETTRTVNVEDTSSKAMVAIDVASFDWSYMADDEAPTNMAFMAFLESEVYTDNTCSKTYLKNMKH
nr:ribonuclease H-like domain-containing protein [Tanacetum cinerariifolium]